MIKLLSISNIISFKLSLLSNLWSHVGRITVFIGLLLSFGLDSAAEMSVSMSTIREEHKRIREFNETFARYRKTPPTTRSSYSLDGHEVVLVSGYLNEIAPSYFKDMVRTLAADFGLPLHQIHIVHSNSLAGDSANIAKIMQKYTSLREKSPGRKIIMVGHSRGGALLLRAFVQNPVLVGEPALERLVLVQAPLKGTPTAHMAADALNVVKASLERLKLLNSICKRCHHEYFADIDAGAKSMEPKPSLEETLSIVDRLSQEEFKTLSRKVLYVTSQSKHQTTKLGTYIIDGKNDGTVPLTSQSVTFFGRRIAALIEIGHTDLILSDIRSNLTTSERRAFARALFEQLLSPMLALESDVKNWPESAGAPVQRKSTGLSTVETIKYNSSLEVQSIGDMSLD